MRFHSVPVRAAIHEMRPGSRQHHFVDTRPVSWPHRIAFLLAALIFGYIIACTVLLGLAQGWLP